MSKARISAVIIALNEERDIRRALASVEWCDEIIVVDSGSTDQTVAICEEFGAKVFHRYFTGYGEQKRFAVERAANDWILSIDADEVIPDDLRYEIQSALRHNQNSNGQKNNGFRIPICTVLWDQVVRDCHRYTRAKLRLFDRRQGNFNSSKVHEGVTVAGPVIQLEHHMYNFAYSNISDYFLKFNAYTNSAAEQKYALNKNSSALITILRFPVEFLRMFLFQGFFRDGLSGFLWSLFSAFYPLVRYAKLQEMYAEDRQVFKKSVKPIEIESSLNTALIPAMSGANRGGRSELE
ncbi:MAG TPA: glycosyltransferase family 2 protein [Blastocatellia bacterium]|nr:glycosyltransferase family 2 protein [Blastocatellia bacterium]